MGRWVDGDNGWACGRVFHDVQQSGLTTNGWCAERRNATEHEAAWRPPTFQRSQRRRRHVPARPMHSCISAGQKDRTTVASVRAANYDTIGKPSAAAGRLFGHRFARISPQSFAYRPPATCLPLYPCENLPEGRRRGRLPDFHAEHRRKVERQRCATRGFRGVRQLRHNQLPLVQPRLRGTMSATYGGQNERHKKRAAKRRGTTCARCV